jgi:hypothetical protein
MRGELLRRLEEEKEKKEVEYEVSFKKKGENCSTRIREKISKKEKQRKKECDGN